MLQSWLLRCFLTIALATIEVGATNNNNVEGETGLASAGVVRAPRGENGPFWERVEHIVVKRESEVDAGRLLFERTPDSTSPRERAAPALGIPQPTAPPQKRQDDNQIRDLSSRIQSISESATSAISSVSSSASSMISLTSQSAESVRQSADQAIQSANQNADDANRQLSQTRSSASSAVSRASDQARQSMASMSSRISSNQASAESSASSAISAAQAEAASLAASQVGEARADASGVRGDANSIVGQVRSNSVSGSNVAILISVSIIGTMIATALVCWLIARYRRKKRRDGRGEATIVVPDEKPVAVRGTPEEPRFTPFGGGTGYPMDKFKLPDLSPIKQSKNTSEPSPNVGLATSDLKPNLGKNEKGEGDIYDVSPTNFRLQKPDAKIKSATSVRLIRVGSDKKKEKAENRPPLSPLASLPTPPPTQPLPSPPPSVREPPRTQRPTTGQSRASMYSTRETEPDIPGWRPPARSTTNSQQQFKFRDSSDVEFTEPTATGWRSSVRNTRSSMRNTNTANMRTSPASQTGSPSEGATSPPRLPKNAGASFATFPKVRDGPPSGTAAQSLVERTRSGAGGVADRRSEKAEVFDGSRESARTSRRMFAGDRNSNWPLNRN